MSQKRIVISTFGSFGDIHPYMALALELQARGHRPVIATMEYYREKIEGAGLEFHATRPNIPAPAQQDQELIEKIMDPKTGPRFLTEQVIFPAVRDSYKDLLEAVVNDRTDLLITHPAAPAGPLVARNTGIKWISTVLAPFSFYSAYDPPVPPYWSWLGNLRVLGPTFMGSCLSLMKATYRAKLVTQFRDELKLGDFGNPMFEGQHSPTRVLALFSSIFAQPQRDWPPQTRTTGFCFYDGAHERPMSDVLNDFLKKGDAPIIFTLGSSAVWVAKDFFKHSVNAAVKVGKRAILLIGDSRNLSERLPDNIVASEYAPYQSLLPRASVIVHHGGVGTTSQCLRAGVPTLIVPFAFDQMDNADHARRLGTSRTLSRRLYSSERVTRELKSLLENNSYAEKARSVGEKLRSENGPSCAADHVEQLLAEGSSISEEPVYALSH